MTKQTETTVQNEPSQGDSGQTLSEAQLGQVAGGSFSWGVQQNALCDGSVRPAGGTTTPAALLPAVQ
jgi:hypothetical protein